MGKRLIRTCLGLGFVSAVGLATPSAHAFTFGGEYMDTWSGCQCSNSGLSQTGDQIHEWADNLEYYQHTRKFVYANSDVWSSDITEDRNGGEDWIYGDAVDLYAYSGHGSAPTVGGVQTYRAGLCSAGTTSDCRFDSVNARWGERGGGFQTPHTGNMRWAIFLTCYSVHTDPMNQWAEATDYGFDYVMGYKNTSVDSHTTDEVGSDWVDAAIADGDSFKSAWFWAIEDWWADDTGGVVASGTTTAGSESRRDHLVKSTARRPANEYHGFMAWAWHEG